MQSNGDKKKHNVTIVLSNEAYITARVLASISGKSMKALLSDILEKWLRSERREAVTKVVETLQTNNQSDAEAMHRTISVNGNEFAGDVPDDVWGKAQQKIQEIYEQLLKEAQGKTLYAMGKKLEQTGHYTGYFWVARDKKGQTHIRGFFVAHGVPEGSQSKKSHIIANFNYILDTGEVKIRWRTQYFTPPGWFPKRKNEGE
jgi:hypothetical protein